jgi:NADPH-dependent curcumin reductase CurA
MVSNKAFVYKSIPHGLPKIGQDLTIESTEFDPSQAPPKNGITTKNYYASFDPAQRGRMRDPKIPSYSPAMTTGTAVGSVSIIAKVLKSDVSRLKEGEWVIGSLPTEEYSVVSEQAAKAVQPVSNPKGLPLEMFLGPMGMTGLTAWGSLQEIGNPKKGETIFVSAASGAVGQM